ncbi:MAG: nucleotidyltransferase domain-containing protein [Dehalococcoidia bacterium]|nr:nucleotidyltransferase domain-containing protein [Dehalococcoidia bacterium]
MSSLKGIISAVLATCPYTQAIYLFGSYGSENEWPDSDVDIALLLPSEEAKRAGPLTTGDLRFALESLLQKDVDLVNLRRASTVFQKEIVFSGRRIFCADEYAADEFEMLVLSFYQKLNEERAEVMAEGLRSGRFYNV